MEGEALQSFIREFIEKMRITIESIEDTSTTGQVIFNITTPDSKQLIGPHGDHLRSLNYLLRRSVERKSEDKEIRFMVDVNNYQQKHIQEIEQKARLLAERVRTFKSSADMAPMTAYERMIVHSLFTDDPEIETASEGMGPTRHVVLSYKQTTP